MVLWLPLFHDRLATLSAFAPVAWHVHEMLFGYLAAIVTGFLLAEIRNWTGRLPLQGGPLPAPVAVSRWRRPTASGGLPDAPHGDCAAFLADRRAIGETEPVPSSHERL